jgi:putative membrane protein
MTFAQFFRSDRWLILLIVIYAAVWGFLAIDPTYRASWWLENLGVFIALPFLFLSYRYFKLSNLSYTLIFAFLCLHAVGSHYTYAEVPLGNWLQAYFDLSRNHFDRIVHFSFGLLIAYPVREVFFRIAQTRGIWGYWLPVELTLALSALFEIGEWMVVAIVNPDAGAAYLGAQGDEFDAVKDMAVAGVGAVIAMAVALDGRRRIDPAFGAELRESIRIKKTEPLGEVAIDRFEKNANARAAHKKRVRKKRREAKQ